MNLLRSFSYSRVDKEDPDEKKHRKAQFLIYKVLEEAGYCRKRRSASAAAMWKFKVKVGSQVIMRRVRKTVRCSSISMAKARACVHEKAMKQVRMWKLGVGVLWRRGNAMDFTPLFA